MTSLWKNIQRFDSSDKNVSKFVYTNQTAAVESVLYKYNSYSERTVICCSTQSGCMRGCRFCGSGDYFVRNLSSDEIVEQVSYLLTNIIDCNPLDIKRLQIMFMSMGEPFQNYEALSEAIEKLYSLYPNAALLVSTSAPVTIDKFKKFEELSVKIPTIGLQFSVHESTDEARQKLIPSKSLTLKQMGEIGLSWHKATGRKPFFNYCVHDKNNSIDDVKRLVGNFNSMVWNSTISVICERDETINQAHNRQEKLAYDFMQLMLSEGYNVRLFNPNGQDDVSAGCGMLWYYQKWAKEHPEFAKPSNGYGKEKVHMPT